MSNLTDALIAAKLVGGSGGSGGGSGLPEIGSTATTVFAEQTLAFSERGNVYGADPLNLVLAIRETYTVTWDGTDYTCTAVDDGSGGVAIGNLSIWEKGPDTGEPFMFGYSSLGNATYIFSSSTAASHTIKITQGSQTPADGTALSVQNGAWAASGAVLPEIVENNVEIVPSQTFSFSGNRVFVSPIPGVTFVVGETYTITWDGITYTCTAIDDNGAALGNMAVAELGDDTGEPFAIIYDGSDYVWLTNDSAATHVCAIAQSGGYLPANGSIMQVVNGAWQPVVPSSGGTEVLPFTVRLSMKSNQTISQSSSRTVTLNFLGNNFPDSWNTAAGLSCYIQKDNTIYELVMLKVEFNLSARNAVATILNPLTNDCTINSTAEMYGYAIKLT